MPLSKPVVALLAAASFASAPAEASLRFFMPFTTGPYALGGPLGQPEGTLYVGDISGNDVAWSYGTGQPLLQGGAMAFDGVDDSIQVQLDVGPTAMPLMSWGAWVKTTDSNPWIRQFLSNDNGSYDRTLGIDARASTAGAYSAFTGQGVLGDSQAAALDTWTFVAATYDQTANSMRLWVDDRYVDASTSFNDAFNTFSIGMNTGHGEYFKGSIYNVFVFDQVLTDSEIDTIRAGGAAAVMAVAAVPEPQTWILCVLGLAALGLWQRRPGSAPRASRAEADVPT